MNASMSLYKPDWEEARQRMIDWWEGKKLDRPVASVTAPVHRGQGDTGISRVPDKYIDFGTVFKNLDYNLEHTFWGAEAFPWHFVYMGPMFTQTFFGCEPLFMENTTWYESRFHALDDLLNVEFDENNRWWKLFREMTQRTARRSHGRYLTTVGGVNSIIDTIAGMIGNENLLVAMAEEPDKLKTVRDKFISFGKRAYDELFTLAREANGGGSVGWLGIWSPKREATAQCDLSVMISPAMFNEFVREDIASTYDYVDHGLYHLDGEDEIRHLDTLLSMEKIKVIQWVPSPKVDGDPLLWVPLFRRIQETGRSVLVENCPCEKVSELLCKIDRDRIFLRLSCPDEAAARRTIKALERAGK